MSLKDWVELLNRQKLVEGMVRSQQMPRQALVEGLVHRQHLTEVRAALVRAPAPEIGAMLESLSIEDAHLLWKQMPKDREDEVLWEPSCSIRSTS